MKLPVGLERLKERAKIPITIEGETEPRVIYEIPEILEAAALLEEMSSILLNSYNTAADLAWYLIDEGSPANSREIEDLAEIIDNIREFMIKFKEWK